MRHYMCLLLSILAAMPALAQDSVLIGDDCDAGPVCFWPNPLTIRVGETVTFYIYCDLVCDGPHNVVADDGSFRCARGCDGEGGDGTPADYKAQWHFTRTFNTPGLVRFHDEVSHVTGLIIVSPGPIGTVVEFYNADRDHYFITADPSEQAYVDTGAVGNWQRTGGAFKSGGPVAVCRFGGNTFVNPATRRAWGPNSHFYTADAGECSRLRSLFNPRAPSWNFESYDFTTTAVGNDGCGANLTPVYRAYNNGFARGIDSNHRITADAAAYQATLAAGWIGEGVVMCAPQ